MILKIKLSDSEWKYFDNIKEVLTKDGEMNPDEKRDGFVFINYASQTRDNGTYWVTAIHAITNDNEAIDIVANTTTFLMNNEGKTIERIY